ncbi:MAG: glycosyltransferase [Pontiellaceae bacterium]|nr:glycosyltransferase [Pontiellaceae bacterium]
MKVCDIVQFYSAFSGGVKRYIDDKIRFFATIPDIEHVVIIPSDRNTVSVVGQTRIHEMKSIRLPGSKSYRLLVSRKRIGKVLDLEQPDIIEVGDPYHTAWIAHGLARRKSIPIIAYYHSDYPRALGRTVSKYVGSQTGRATERAISHYLRRLYNRMDATVVAAPIFEKVLQEIGVERIIRVPLGTDTERFHPIDEREQVINDLGLASGCRLLLYVGRLAREKNVVSLVQMMDYFPDNGSVALLLVGDGEQGEQIRRMARTRDNVFWHPYCTSPELLSVFYSAADVFIHPGTSETFGLVSLEAQACGTPVVVVKNGGAESTLEHEPHAAVAKTCSPEDLLEATSALLRRSETKQDRMERRRSIINFYGRDTTCRLMLDLYELICKEHADKPADKESQSRLVGIR